MSTDTAIGADRATVADRPTSDEEEFEPSYGLPESLPAGERLLWQGSPRWQSIARDALHLRGLSAYFAVLLVLRAANTWYDGASAAQALTGTLPLALLAALAIALLVGLAWLIEKTSIYTVTSERVVMRIGVVLSITFNLPYRRIEAAGLRVHTDGSGDIPLQLTGEDRIAYVHLWPHARPWQVKRTQPMLRGVADARRVAQMLAGALAAVAGTTAPVIPAAPAVPERQAPSSSPARQPQVA